MRAESSNNSLRLAREPEYQAILYGVRYWARDELMLTDEYYSEGRGVIMYPIRDVQRACDDPRIVAREIVSELASDNDWTVFSVHDLIGKHAEQKGRPVNSVLRALSWLNRRHAGLVVMIPTSRSLATFTAKSDKVEKLQLRSYYQDEHGHFVSHIRIHKRLGEVLCDGRYA